jgi:serine/threonine protein kinase
MGEVYKARVTRLDRTVAVKIFPSHLSEKPEAKQRFNWEASANIRLTSECPRSYDDGSKSSHLSNDRPNRLALFVIGKLGGAGCVWCPRTRSLVVLSHYSLPE